MGGQGEGLAKLGWAEEHQHAPVQALFVSWNEPLPCLCKQPECGGAVCCQSYEYTSLQLVQGGLCCSTEGLGAIKPMGYSHLRVYIYMVLILSLGSRLCGASKHLGVPWSGFHQHPNTIAPRCFCFPLSLGSNPWRSQSKEGSELSSPPVHAKSRLPAPLDLHAVMQPCGMPAANRRVWVSAAQGELQGQGRSRNVLCNFLN